jgi:hypothetical protein
MKESKSSARNKPLASGAPRWKVSKRVVTLTMSREWALSLAQTLNEWKAWTPWVDRADCKNWKRSLIARENKRESQTFGNCLSTITAALGRRHLNKLMTEAAAIRAAQHIKLETPVSEITPKAR